MHKGDFTGLAFEADFLPGPSWTGAGSCWALCRATTLVEGPQRRNTPFMSYASGRQVGATLEVLLVQRLERVRDTGKCPPCWYAQVGANQA